jgi:hypothetical protein
MMSCGGEIAAPPIPVATAVEMTPASLVAFEGTSTRLAAVVRAADGKPMVATLRWSTSDMSVAAVESDGTVRALKSGSATITATITGNAAVTATCTVVVRPVPVATVRIASAPSPLYLGRPTQLNASVLDSAEGVLTNRPVTWSSSDSLIADISSTGTLLGKSPGTVQILAHVENVVGTITLDVRPGDEFVFAKYVDGLTKLFSMNADGSGLTNIAPDTAFNYSPSWSPDGKRVAELGIKNGAELRILTLGSPVIQSFPQTKGDWVDEPTWSPNGNEIAYSYGSLLSTVIKVIDVATGAMRTVSTVNNTMYPQWSPNGQLLSYTAGGRLFINNGNGTAETMVRADGVSTWSQCWGDDAHLYYWVSSYPTPGDLYVATVGVNTIVSAKLSTGIADSSPATVTCSKRGQVAVALNADGNSHNPTYVVSTDGKNVRLLPLPADAFVSASWSGDGTRLYLSTFASPSAPNSLRRLDADGSLTTLQTNTPFSRILWNPIR